MNSTAVNNRDCILESSVKIITIICDSVVLEIYLDHKFQCMNCESLAYKVVT